MRAFLKTSKLIQSTVSFKNKPKKGLKQDRYSLRTASQWIGPYIEDLLLVDRQIMIELNSSCDNPLVDVQANTVRSGGNFQATAVTTAMEKTRLAIQAFGRLLFTQVTEMIDPSLNHGLPANLAADDPSLSFTMKGVDISMASYMAELAFLANPISTHVQPAEMHNQAVNSMAFASARISMQAVELLQTMCACALYVGCQAVDLRVLHNTFMNNLNQAIVPVNARLPISEKERESLHEALCARFQESWDSSGTSDLRDRCTTMIESSVYILTDALIHSGNASCTLADIQTWTSSASRTAWATWTSTFDAFAREQNTLDFLGKSSSVLYRIVRKDLGVPFHLGFIEHPTVGDETLNGRKKKTVGGWIEIVREGLTSGRIMGPLIEMMEAEGNGHAGSHQDGSGENGHGNGSA